MAMFFLLARLVDSSSSSHDTPPPTTPTTTNQPPTPPTNNTLPRSKPIRIPRRKNSPPDIRTRLQELFDHKNNHNHSTPKATTTKTDQPATVGKPLAPLLNPIHAHASTSSKPRTRARTRPSSTRYVPIVYGAGPNWHWQHVHVAQKPKAKKQQTPATLSSPAQRSLTRLAAAHDKSYKTFLHEVDRTKGWVEKQSSVAVAAEDEAARRSKAWLGEEGGRPEKAEQQQQQQQNEKEERSFEWGWNECGCEAEEAKDDFRCGGKCDLLW